MAINGVGYGSTVLGQSVRSLNEQLTTLSAQLTTGKKATTYAGMGVNEGFAIAARAQLSNMTAFTDTMTKLNTTISVANTALQSLVDIGTQVQNATAAASQALNSSGQSIAQQNAGAQLGSMLGILNTQSGDRYIFSGAAIDTPSASHLWYVGETIDLAGRATDTEDGALGGSALEWSLVMLHCPSNCHEHDIGTVGTGKTGSFVAPDHEYPSSLQLTLTATDSWGLSASKTIVLDPQTVRLWMRSDPSGLRLQVNGVGKATPFGRTVIVGSMNTITALTPQSLGGLSYLFSSWSDGGAATHTIVAPSSPQAYRATYAAS